MERMIYIQNEIISLAEYLPEDNFDNYNNWLDEETRSGFNMRLTESFEDLYKRESKGFNTSIMRNDTKQIIGHTGISPYNDLPDLSIRIYRPFRGKGYGTIAFKLAAKYCFEALGYEKIYTGCFPGNIPSQRMLESCGFIPNPPGNIEGKHYLTGEPVTQYDYVLHNPKNSGHERMSK